MMPVAIHILDINCLGKQDKRVKDLMIFYTSRADCTIWINLNGHLSKYKIVKETWMERQHHHTHLN